MVIHEKSNCFISLLKELYLILNIAQNVLQNSLLELKYTVIQFLQQLPVPKYFNLLKSKT